jgi:hypothetical protein
MFRASNALGQIRGANEKGYAEKPILALLVIFLTLAMVAGLFYSNQPNIAWATTNVKHLKLKASKGLSLTESSGAANKHQYSQAGLDCTGTKTAYYVLYKQFTYKGSIHTEVIIKMTSNVKNGKSDSGAKTIATLKKLPLLSTVKDPYLYHPNGIDYYCHTNKDHTKVRTIYLLDSGASTYKKQKVLGYARIIEINAINGKVTRVVSFLDAKVYPRTITHYSGYTFILGYRDSKDNNYFCRWDGSSTTDQVQKCTRVTLNKQACSFVGNDIYYEQDKGTKGKLLIPVCQWSTSSTAFIDSQIKSVVTHAEENSLFSYILEITPSTGRVSRVFVYESTKYEIEGISQLAKDSTNLYAMFHGKTGTVKKSKASGDNRIVKLSSFLAGYSV